MDVKSRGKLRTLKTNVAGLDGRKHHRNAKRICGEPRAAQSMQPWRRNTCLLNRSLQSSSLGINIHDKLAQFFRIRTAFVFSEQGVRPFDRV